jgi:valyl-tRNA synthetase
MIDLEKAYDHSKVENKIYKMWEESGYFNPDNLPGDRKESYTIIMPPPNANAPLHVGHALGMTIEDILIRYHRMQGKKALWLPGTDHAGFETQVVFEKRLEKEGSSRFKMTREEFYKACWDFVQNNKHISEEGMKRLGASCDWSRNIFTLDPEITKIVYQTFKKMFDDGLVYRAGRICNWCPKHQTGLADLETKYEERIEPFYYFKYGPFTIGTSRPETKFGDKYVVMHPADKRYSQYKQGDTFETEWINGPITATVIKDEAVDMEFGSGVMTITPAHDPVDFEIAQRHKLDIEDIIDKRGKLLPIAGEFAGTKILEARPKIVEKLKTKGLLEKTDNNYKHNVQLCYKCGNLIEPQIVPQWYIAMTKQLPDGRPSLRDMAVKAIRNKEVEILTEKFEKIFMHWMENIRDWPISRQIWWGIPIPVWYDEAGKTYFAKQLHLTFVRHAESEANAQKITGGWIDAPLTEEGKEQAKQTAETFKKGSYDYIISSDLKRASHTAQYIAEKLNLSVQTWPELREVDGGQINNTPRIKGKSILERVVEEGVGETLDQLEIRAKLAVKKLSEFPEGSRIVIAAHNSFLSILSATLDGKNKHEFVANRQQWHLANAGVMNKTVLLPPLGDNLTQDPDTFDTWFSSGQWPFATLMASDAKKQTSTYAKATADKVASSQQPDFETFFPTQVMETGWDILFFWVARMVMMSYYKTNKAPFQKVYLHGLVRDKEKQKMSKSKGNVVDPLGVIDTYGTDALRFALIFSTSAGNDIPLAEDKIKGMKHFANKLWNIARFTMANIESSDHKWEAKTDADQEILTKLDQTIKNSTTLLEAFKLHEAAQDIYQFTWHELADIYLEKSKAQLQDPALKENTQKLLLHNLIMVLKLLHPFMPFVTEHIWQLLKERELVKTQILMITEWPKAE